jgi:hypothetical protein
MATGEQHPWALMNVRVAAALALFLACVFTVGGLASSSPKAPVAAAFGPLCVVLAVGIRRGQWLAAWAMVVLTVAGFGLLIAVERGRDLATWLGLLISTVLMVRAARDLRRLARPEHPGEAWVRALFGLVLAQTSGSVMFLVWAVLHSGAGWADPSALVEIVVGAFAGGASQARLLGAIGLLAMYVFGTYQLRRLRRDTALAVTA